MTIRMASLAALSLVALVAAAPAGQAAPRFNPFGIFGGDAPPSDAVDGGAVELAQAGDPARVNRLEAQVRDLTGQVEVLTHEVQQLQALIQRMQQDADFRLRTLEGGKTTAAAPQVQAQPLPQQDTVAAAPLPDDGVQILGAPPQPLGQLTLDAPSGEQPLDLSTLAGGGAETGGTLGTTTIAPPPANDVQLASIQPTGDPRTDYDQAYRLITAGQYDLAERAFRQFLTAYPSDELAPEAQYWLGESLFAHGDYATAAEEFKTGYQTYPKSRRAPDSLLKLGLSMAGLGYRAEACKMYALAVKQYPNMPNGLRQRVKNEQASAAC